MDLLLIFGTLLIIGLIWLIIWLPTIWRKLNTKEGETLKDSRVPDGRGVFWAGKQIMGPLSNRKGPSGMRPDPLTGGSEYFIGMEITNQAGEPSVEWVWTGEIATANLECYTGDYGMTWKRIEPNLVRERMRMLQAQVFLLKKTLADKTESDDNRMRREFDELHNAIQKFLPKVTYEKGKKKPGEIGLPMGGGDSE